MLEEDGSNPPPLPPSVPAPPELMAVSFKGITIDISKDSWFSLKAAFPHLVDVPSLSPKGDSAIQISSTDSKDQNSSSDIPPGFEPAKKKSKRTKKKISSSNPSHRPFRKHLAMIKKGEEDDRTARRLRRAALNLGLQNLAKKSSSGDAGESLRSS
ncbi:uncharacterized protein LOC109850642 [Asparagus officinalis]|nr:uncharacterized protein LOC109850642 [Asparagus officinalis]